MTDTNRHGLTESSFRKFENAIRDACIAFPAGVKISIPADMSELTITARLRDAIRSLRLNNWAVSWDSANISKLTVHHNSDGVFIGKPTKNEALKSLKVLPPDTDSGLLLTDEELKAFCLLITNKRFEGPIIFRCPDCKDWDMIEASYDVSIVPHGPDETFLLF